MIVHGAGSFGHVVAKEYGLQNGYSNGGQIRGMVRVSRDVRTLNALVMDELIAAGIDAVSIPTGSCFRTEGGRLTGDTAILKGYLKLGIMPVMFGDVILDSERGFGICSGDGIMEFLASAFDPELAVFVSDVDGLFDSDPKTNRNAKLIRTADIDALAHANTDAGVADVTGGVRGKMETMLRMCAPGRDCILINGNAEGRLRDALEGKEVTGTRATVTV